MPDSRPKGRGLEPHHRHCVVSLSKTHLSSLSTGSTQEETEKNVDWDVKNQIKENKNILFAILNLYFSLVSLNSDLYKIRHWFEYRKK